MCVLLYLTASCFALYVAPCLCALRKLPASLNPYFLRSRLFISVPRSCLRAQPRSDSGTASFFLPSAVAAVSFLVPFTLNFTITNLHYEEDMQHPGSKKFNTTERILQDLVRPCPLKPALPTLPLPYPVVSAQSTPLTPPPHHLYPVHLTNVPAPGLPQGFLLTSPLFSYSSNQCSRIAV